MDYFYPILLLPAWLAAFHSRNRAVKKEQEEVSLSFEAEEAPTQFSSSYTLRTVKEGENKVSINIECRVVDVHTIKGRIRDLVKKESDSLNYFQDRLERSLYFIPKEKIRITIG